MFNTYTPIAFFGRFFVNQKHAVDYLKEQGTDYASDMFDPEAPYVLTLELQSNCSYALGFHLTVGTCDSELRKLWQHRMGFYDTEAGSHMFVRVEE